MPGQPIYDTVVPFFSASSTRLTDLAVVGGRTLTFDYVVPVDYALPSLVGCAVSAQIRDTPTGTLLAQFHCEVTGATTVTFSLNPKQTQDACASGLTRAYWDAEVLVDGVEYGLVPLSRVTLQQGVTHINGSYPEDSARADAFALNASVVVS